MTLPIAHLGWVSAEPMYGEPYESVVVNGEVSFHEQSIDLSTPLQHPEALFLAVTTEGLISGGITVSGGIGGYVTSDKVSIFQGDDYPGHHLGAEHRNTLYVYWSPPLCQIIQYINTESHNLGAELLIRYLGWKINNVGNFHEGKRAVDEWLTTVGINPYDITWVDGSGLARRNLMSPRWVVQLLQVMAQHPYSPYFYESLAIMGETGTLKNRGINTAIAEQVHAKTGTMSGVSNISGYLQTKKGHRLVFSIMSNGTTQYLKQIQETQEQILKILYDAL